MPLRLFDPTKPIPWVHPAERDSDGKAKPDATIFYMIPLTEGKARTINTVFAADGKPATSDVNAWFKALFMECIVKIENALLPGFASPRTISGPDDLRQFWDCIPAEYCRPIYIALQNMKELDEGTTKNSVDSHALPLS